MDLHNRKWICLLTAMLGTAAASAAAWPEKPEGSAPTPIADAYREAARRIMDTTLSGNDAYTKLMELCDDIGHRLSGSPQLDAAIHWAADALRRDGMDTVGVEEVMVPHWVRGEESLVMIAPRTERLPLLGLGGSVGTPPEGLTAEVVVVGNEEELTALGDGARGKIVLFNNPMPPFDPEHGSGYGTAVRFRSHGARLASAKGAVGCLIRSVTASNLTSAHTGAMRYGEAKNQIPAAAIGIEHAEMLARFQQRGVPVKVTLHMAARSLPDAPSGNVIGELRGSTWPEQIVVLGGHLDSWDVGQGAHDDGAGCVMAMEAVNVLRKMELRPKRTIRVVLWTNEENGLRGAKDYAERHADELANHVAAIESDAGAFHPTGFSLECSDTQRQQIAADQMRDILTLLAPVDSTSLTIGGSGADLWPLKSSGIPLMGHSVDMSTYFDYHHSHADTIDKVDPADLSKNVAVLATVAYVLADMPQRLGTGAHPSGGPQGGERRN